MIVEEHPDQDAIKSADGGHEAKPILAFLAITPENSARLRRSHQAI